LVVERVLSNLSSRSVARSIILWEQLLLSVVDFELENMLGRNIKKGSFIPPNWILVYLLTQYMICPARQGISHVLQRF
jgi:hypothetical protein